MRSADASSSLLDSEMARLERMLTRRGQQPVADLSLDDVLLPLVESQRTLGTDVRYGPRACGRRARADDVAEVAAHPAQQRRHATHPEPW